MASDYRSEASGRLRLDLVLPRSRGVQAAYGNSTKSHCDSSRRCNLYIAVFEGILSRNRAPSWEPFWGEITDESTARGFTKMPGLGHRMTKP